MLRLIILVVISLLAVAPSQAKTFIATIYSDGYSCPENCDAHVVFRKSVNGTRNAFLPSSSQTAPKECVIGQECRICFSDDAKSCINAMYRKSGPATGRFDFTPAFYQANCGKPELPTAFANVCKSFDKQYAKYTKDKVYCLENPAQAGCGEIIAKAESARAADEPFWQECRSLGEDKFNAKYKATPKRQRANDCAYESHGTGGPNSKGEYWKRLLPAACWPGTYVGRDGTDCCGKTRMSLGGLGSECTPFLVKK